jgi:hypothetical protein
MFRKLTLALGATVAIAAAALVPTSASAHMHGGHGHGHGHWGHGYGWRVGIAAPLYVTAPDCYIVKKVVDTPVGPRVRRITICD